MFAPKDSDLAIISATACAAAPEHAANREEGTFVCVQQLHPAWLGMLGLIGPTRRERPVGTTEKKTPARPRCQGRRHDTGFYADDHSSQPGVPARLRGKKNVALAFYIFAFTGG